MRDSHPLTVVDVTAVQSSLDLQLEAAGPDAAVPFVLTDKARRQVAAAPTAAELPVLDDPTDPRRAGARALRRGGLSPQRIARRLGVDELAVRVWIGDARPVRPDRTRPTAGEELPTIDPAEREHRRMRDAAAAELPRRLASVAFTRGLSLVAATADIDRHAVLATTADPHVATRVVSWLVDHAGADRAAIRVVVRVGDRRGGDLAAKRWADRLAVDVGAVRVVGWTAPPEPDAVQVMVRHADPTVAARVVGWRDALLTLDDPDAGPGQVAF